MHAKNKLVFVLWCFSSSVSFVPSVVGFVRPECSVSDMWDYDTNISLVLSSLSRLNFVYE